MQRIAREVSGPIITGLARAVAADIDQCWEAIKDAERPRIHTFLSSADIHLERSLQREQAKARAVAMVARAKSYTPDVEFSPMDATRSDWAYVARSLEAVIDAGATTVNIPDTSASLSRTSSRLMITYMREHVANIDRATISVHCHNDLGLAVANSLAAIRAGARQVECCVNGIGERAGNAALEELVMALTVRRDHHHVEHGINSSSWCRPAACCSSSPACWCSPTRRVVRRPTPSATTHAYEHVGSSRTGTLVLQDRPPRLRTRLEELGLLLNQEELNHAFTGFKSLSDYKTELTDADLVQIAQQRPPRRRRRLRRHRSRVSLTRFRLAVLGGDGIGPEVVAEAVKVLRAVEATPRTIASS